MNTLLTPRPSVRTRDALRIMVENQERLFGDGPIEAAEPAAPPVTPPPPSEARAVTAGVPPGATVEAEEPTAAATATAATLDAAMTSLWQRLSAAEPATCPVCDGPLEPRHAAGAGVVGGRCHSCGSTIA